MRLALVAAPPRDAPSPAAGGCTPLEWMEHAGMTGFAPCAALDRLAPMVCHPYDPAELGKVILGRLYLAHIVMPCPGRPGHWQPTESPRRSSLHTEALTHLARVGSRG